MRDNDDGVLRFQSLDQLLNFRGRDRIERGARFIHQQDFRLDSEGARLFCRITRQHTNDRFAILLDNQVLTAPTINEPICGGSGQISGNFTPQSASELALMLNAGALPTPLATR